MDQQLQVVERGGGEKETWRWRKMGVEKDGDGERWGWRKVGMDKDGDGVEE